MADELTFTGERFTPECVREIRYEHVHRYALATRFCEGARVLDAACGEGYGSALLARSAAEVVGVDVSGEAVGHARRRYAADNLSFEVADVARLPFADASFDRVVSFETLEHLHAQEAMIREFRRVLRPDGVLLLSSPDKAVYSGQLGNRNEFHVRELLREELETLLGDFFPAVKLLGQKLMFHSVIWDPDQVSFATAQSLDGDGGLQDGVAHPPVYFIAFCAAAVEQLPELAGMLWLFDDFEESVYAHYYHEIRKNIAAGGLLQQREDRIRELEEQLARLQGKATPPGQT